MTSNRPSIVEVREVADECRTRKHLLEAQWGFETDEFDEVQQVLDWVVGLYGDTRPPVLQWEDEA